MLGVLLMFLLFCFSRGEVDSLKSFLESVNPPSVQNFTLSNGDIILCVQLKDQISLTGIEQELQMKPSAHYLLGRGRKSHRNLQLFSAEVGSCNEGTIPVLYTPPELVRSFGSLDDYLTKVRKYSAPRYRQPGNSILETRLRHEYAFAYLHGNFTGLQATVNVWKPYIEENFEFTLSQLWVMSRKEGPLNTLEAGWQLYPQIYNGSRDTRLFVYWTSDGYSNTGCYNLLCKGFIQVNRMFVLGGSLSPVSALGSKQYEQTVSIFQDNVTSNWWLHINGLDVGYWPARLFNSLNDGAELVELGGEVASGFGAHTKTQMGSGAFPEKGFKQAAYHRRIMYLDMKGNTRPAYKLQYQADRPSCYNTASASDFTRGSLWGAAFFFGGPGWSKQCQ